MSDILTDFSAPALVKAIEGNLCAFFSSFAPLPGSDIHDTPSLLRITTGPASMIFNGVVRAQLDPTSVDQVIDATLEHFKSRKVLTAFWWMSPLTQPATLARTLKMHGFVPDEINASGMAADLSALRQDLPAPAALRIERVRDKALLAEWCRLFNLTYDAPASSGRAWEHITLGIGLAKLPWRYYVGFLADKPVSIAMMHLGAGVAGVYAIGTVRAARRQGIGTAITLAALREAQQEGSRIGILHSAQRTVSLYQKMGFQEYCKLSRYQWYALP